MLFRVRGVVSLALGVYHWANHGTHIRKQLRPLAVGVCATSDGGSSSGSSTRDAEHTHREVWQTERGASLLPHKADCRDGQTMSKFEVISNFSFYFAIGRAFVCRLTAALLSVHMIRWAPISNTAAVSLCSSS